MRKADGRARGLEKQKIQMSKKEGKIGTANFLLSLAG